MQMNISPACKAETCPMRIGQTAGTDRRKLKAGRRHGTGSVLRQGQSLALANQNWEQERGGAATKIEAGLASAPAWMKAGRAGNILVADASKIIDNNEMFGSASFASSGDCGGENGLEIILVASMKAGGATI